MGPPKAGRKEKVFWTVRRAPGVVQMASGPSERPKFRACGERATTRKPPLGSSSDLCSILARRYGLEKSLALTRGGMPLVARPLYGPEFEMFRAVPLVSPAATTRPLPEGGGGSGGGRGLEDLRVCLMARARARTGVFRGLGFVFVCGGNLIILSLSLVRVVLPMANSRRLVSLPAYIPHVAALWPPKLQQTIRIIVVQYPRVPLRPILCQDLQRLPI